MAEFIFKALIKARGIEEKFYVASSATSNEEIWNGVGNPVYPPAKEELLRHGIKCDGKRAVRLCREDAQKYDMFIGMDSANIRNMRSILGDGAQDKIYKLMDFTSRPGDVSDPWYSDRFDIAYRDIHEGCVGLIEYLTSNIDK